VLKHSIGLGIWFPNFASIT